MGFFSMAISCQAGTTADKKNAKSGEKVNNPADSFPCIEYLLITAYKSNEWPKVI